MKIVVLILTVWNADNGLMLYERRIENPIGFAINGDRIEACRLFGVSAARKLTDNYRLTYPNATTNVNCHWEDRIGAPA